jgi:diguanylate cyclase (GGDEF)-like protein/PAS domain S-box-containing protein
MPWQKFNLRIGHRSQKMSLRSVLLWAFVIQTFAAMGLTGYLAFRNSQQAVNNLVNQLMSQVSDRVCQHLDEYLNNAQQVNQLNADAITTGQLNLDRFDQIEKYFWHQRKQYQFTYMNYGSASRKFLGVGQLLGRMEIAEVTPQQPNKLYSYLPDAQGKRLKLHHVESINPTTEAWYIEGRVSQKPIWSPIYNWADNPKELSIAASYPIYDRQNRFQGVLGIDLSLSTINRFLQQLDSSTGTTFILERSGLIVASSSSHGSYIVKNGAAKQLQARESQDPLIQATAKGLVKTFDSLQEIDSDRRLEFQFEGQRQFVRIKPYQDKFGLDWLIVVTVPEGKFIEKINANTQTTLLLFLIAFLIAEVMAILMARRITEPILQLNDATQKFAAGTLTQPVEVNSSKEIGELAVSFNDMAQQLQASFTELKTLNQALLQSESRLSQFLEALPIGISVHHPDGTVAYLNQTGRALLGLDTLSPDTSHLGHYTQNMYRVGSNQPYDFNHLPLNRVLQGDQISIDNLELKKGSTRIPLEVQATPIFDEAGNIRYAIAALQDITERKQTQTLLNNYNLILREQVKARTRSLEQEIRERKRTQAALQAANQELQSLSRVDSLTQVANRRYFDEHLDQEWNRLIREKLPLSLIFCDVDFFKLYNDTYGHQAGDECLCTVAQCLHEIAKRPRDLVARYGGEEFAVILPNTPQAGAIIVAQRIQAGIKALDIDHKTSKVNQQVTLSMGIATIIPIPNLLPTQLTAAADHALYKAKSNGRNCFKVGTLQVELGL